MRTVASLETAPFSPDLHTFDLRFTITDGASGISGTATFHGTLEGFMTRVNTPPPLGGSATQLQVAFTGQSQQSLQLGDHLYKVSIDPFMFRYQQALQSLGQVISPYQDVPISVQLSEVPEPSTLALAAAGLAAMGWRAWRRRKGLAGAV
jgi:hypothetical protein